MSGKIGKDFKYNFKFTTTPPKGPDYEEVKAVLGQWIDLGSHGDPELLDSLDVWKSVQESRATDKLLRQATWIRPRQTASALVAEYRKLVADFPQLLEL